MTWGEYQIVFLDDGASSFDTLKLSITDYTSTPPELNTHYVSIPGRVDGYLDLTDALNGYPTYSSRNMTFTCLVMLDESDREDYKTRLYNYLHGKSKRFSLTFDPEYTYTGRFTVDSVDDTHRNTLVVVLSAVCKPYKQKMLKTHMLNAAGGMTYEFVSGARPVNPTIECDKPVIVRWNDTDITVGAGTWRLNDVVFTSGINQIYINSMYLTGITWADVKQGQAFAMTWDEAAQSRWSEHAKKALEANGGLRPQAWSELRDVYTWASIQDSGLTWEELNWTQEQNATVYLQYSWEDL